MQGMTLHQKILLGTCLLLASALSFAAPANFPAQASYEVGFSPSGEAQQIVLNGIRGARKEILVAAYSFTSKPVSAALVDAHKRGVQVAVIADEGSNGDRYTATTFLANNGVPVRLNGRYGSMHNKFMVIDQAHIETGSFNFSGAANQKNAENVVLMRDVPALAGKYRAEWVRLWNEGRDLAPAY